MDPISTVEKGSYIIEIRYDDAGDCTSPREWDNVGRMVCEHRRYNLGDSETTLGFKFRSDDFDNWEAVEKWLYDEQDALVVIPMSMLDHSGLYISAGVSRGWDSGQIGYAYATREQAKENWPELEGAALIERVEKCLLAEIEAYSDYVAGNVYCYRIRCKCPTCGHPETVASCHGYIGETGAKDAMAAALIELEGLLEKEKGGSIGADTQTA